MKGRAASFFYFFFNFLPALLSNPRLQEVSKPDQGGANSQLKQPNYGEEKKLLYRTPVDLADSLLGRDFFLQRCFDFFGLARFKRN